MFTVAIPIFNHARYVRAAVSSALASPLVLEILLVDDGSSDESASIARSLALANPTRVKNLSENLPVNKGAHVRLNELCRAASQPWIAVLNSDDLFAPHRFETAALLIKATKCEFISGSLLLIDDMNQPIGRKRGILDPEYSCDLFTGWNAPLDAEGLRGVLCNQNILATTSNMLFTRELFHRIGGFADLRYSHDWDFALRATQLGRCLWTPNPLTVYRLHATNTIKEVTPHLKGEVVRFFYRFLTEFPEVERDRTSSRALEYNQYIHPYVGLPPSGPLPLSAVVQSRAELSSVATRRRLASSALCLAWFAYDYLLISTGLLNTIDLKTPLRVITPSLLLNDTPDSLTDAETIKSRGHYLRLPGMDINGDEFGAPELLPENAPPYLSGLKKPTGIRDQPHAKTLKVFHSLIKPTGTKPRCLILPMFFAVGGVERNTIEILRQLCTEFDFLVVSTERHAEAQGSLIYQLDELGIPSIDLAEVADRFHHLRLLASVKEAFRPDLVWICNGSPWLVDSAPSLRRLFAEIPIIDQQVYDVQAGWIEHYATPGIQAADHFIAINRRIHEKFIRGLRIPKHRVSLIYSAVSPSRIRESRTPPASIAQTRCSLGIPETKGCCYAFIARLSPQKRPLRYLDLAKRALAAGHPDIFLLVGGGELESQCMDFIQSEKLTNVVRITYSDNTPQLLSVCDALVMTSAFEGLPIVLLECLGVGTPAFCTDVGDIADLLGEIQQGGVVSSELSADAAWDAFLEFAQNRQLFHDRAMSARDEVLNRFSAEKIANQYRKCFHDAVRSTKR